jgi:hypothetical protein
VGDRELFALGTFTKLIFFILSNELFSIAGRLKLSLTFFGSAFDDPHFDFCDGITA